MRCNPMLCPFGVSGNLPFYDLNDAVVVTRIMDVAYDVPDGVSEGCKDLLGKLLVKEPEGRFTAQQALGHPWLQLNHGESAAHP